MTGRDLKLAILGVVAVIAAGLGIKWGQRKADKRVEKVANDGAEIMKERIHERAKEELGIIDDRPVTDDVVADLESRLGYTKPRRDGDGS